MIPERVVLRYLSSTRARVLFRYLHASKVAMDFPSEQAMRQYLKEHPKADKSKHKVVDRTVTETEGYTFHDAKEVATSLAQHWHGHGSENDPVSKLIDALSKGSEVSRSTLEAALKASDGKSKSVNYTIRDLIDEVDEKGDSEQDDGSEQDVPKPAVPKPAVPKPVTPKSTPSVAPVKAVRRELTLPKPDAALVRKLDNAVSSAKPKNKLGPLSPSHISRLLGSVGVSSESVNRAADWSKAWVYGGGVGEMDASKKAINDFTEALKKPNSWARMKYEATQSTIRADMKQLQKSGIMDADGYVTLYRGVRGNQAKSLKGKSDVALEVRDLSSWSDSLKCAKKFSDGNKIVIAAKIHYTYVAGMWSSEGFYWSAKDEHEWTVLSDGKSIPATVKEGV